MSNSVGLISASTANDPADGVGELKRDLIINGGRVIPGCNLELSLLYLP